MNQPRAFRFKSQNITPTPNQVLLDDLPRLHAAGTATVIVVRRGPLSRDTDPSWIAIHRLILDRGLTILDDTTTEAEGLPAVRTITYVHPRNRRALGDTGRSAETFRQQIADAMFNE